MVHHGAKAASCVQNNLARASLVAVAHAAPEKTHAICAQRRGYMMTCFTTGTKEAFPDNERLGALRL